MQPSRSFDWGTVVTLLRLILRVLGVAAAMILALSVDSALTEEPGRATDPALWMIWGVIGAGLVLALFWQGIGEVVGGLALFGAVLALAMANWPLQGVEPIAAPVDAVASLLFVICGWYSLTHRQVGSQPRVPTPA